MPVWRLTLANHRILLCAFVNSKMLPITHQIYYYLPGLGATLASRIFKSNAILREVQKEVERIFQGYLKLSIDIIFVQVLCITGLQPGGRQYRDLFCRIILIIIINYQMIILTCDGYEYDFPHHDIHYSYAQKHEIQCRCQAPFRQI